MHKKWLNLEGKRIHNSFTRVEYYEIRQISSTLKHFFVFNQPASWILWRKIEHSQLFGATFAQLLHHTKLQPNKWCKSITQCYKIETFSSIGGLFFPILLEMQKRKVFVSMIKIIINANKKQVTDFVSSPSIWNKGQLELSWPTFLILIVFFYYFYPTTVFLSFSSSHCLFLSNFFFPPSLNNLEALLCIRFKTQSVRGKR